MRQVHYLLPPLCMGLLLLGFAFLLFSSVQSSNTSVGDSVSSFPPGSIPEDMTIADLNGNGKLDVVVFRGINIMMFFNTGYNMVGPVINYKLNEAPRMVRFEENKKNKRPDLLVTNEVDSSLTVLRNDGNGRFTLLSTTPDLRWLKRG